MIIILLHTRSMRNKQTENTFFQAGSTSHRRESSEVIDFRDMREKEGVCGEERVENVSQIILEPERSDSLVKQRRRFDLNLNNYSKGALIIIEANK